MLKNKNILFQKIVIGELAIKRMGLGTNRITDTDNAAKLLNRSVEIGIHFIDTADIYTYGASETMIGKTLSPYPLDVIIATKGGMTRDERKVDGRPEHLRQTLENSLKRLKIPQIHLYQLHRIDPKVPLAESVGALRQMQIEGKIKHIGLSEVTVEQIQEAQRIATIVSVQNEYNLTQRKYEAVINYCEAEKIIFIPWAPLERGHLSESKQVILNQLTKKYNATTHQISLAWLLKRSPIILPIPGTLSISHLQENLAALDLELMDEDFALCL